VIGRSLRALALVPLLVAALANQASAQPGNAGSDGPPTSRTTPSGPPLLTSTAMLAAALRCHDSPHPAGHKPVLLVPGITQTGPEAWDWNYVPALTNAGFDVCTVDLLDRGLADIQTSTEHVVYAVRQMRDHYHSKIDILGFSEGTLESRWAIKFWLDVRNSVDDMVALAAPYHGTALGNIGCSKGSCVPAAWHASIGSNFIKTLNAGDETPGDVSYTSVYTLTDNVIFPQLPKSVSEQGGSATNVAIQSICPRVVDHVGTTADAVAYALVLDAFTHPGPADPARIDLSVCGQLYLPGVTLESFVTNVTVIYATGLPRLAGIPYPTVTSEPPLRCYARPEGCSQ
jgi:triacylglycerol lipase